MALPVGVVVNVSEVGLVDVLMGVLRSVLVDVGVLVRDMLVLMGGVRVRVGHAGMLVVVRMRRVMGVLLGHGVISLCEICCVG